MLARRCSRLASRPFQAYREASRSSSSSRPSKLVQAAVTGFDRALQQSQGKKPTINWVKDNIRPEILDAEAIVRGVKTGRMDKTLVPHLRHSTRIACLVLGQLVKPDHAVSFFVWAAKQDGFKHDATSANQFLETLVRGGQAADAYAIFKQRFSRMFKPDAFTYTMLIRGLCDAGKTDEACELFNEMHGQGGGSVKTMSAVYTALLHGLLKAGKLDDALSYFQMMQESAAPPDAPTYNTMVYELGRQGSVDHAAKLAREMVDGEKTPDMASLGVVVELLCRKGRVGDAWKLLGLMREKRCKPDTVMHTYVLRKFCEAGELDRALEGFEEMSGNERFEPDFVTYSVIVDGLCAAGRAGDAVKLMERMMDEEKMPDVPTFRSLVESHSKTRLAEEDGEKAEPGKTKRAKPTVTMYTLLLYGLFWRGGVEEALELYGQVSSGPGGPSTLTYWVMIDGLGRHGRAVEAEEVFSDSLRRGAAPQTMVYNALVSGLCRTGRLERALELLREMAEKQCPPDAATYGFLLGGICKAERVDDAISLLREASGRGLEIDRRVYRRVASLLRKAGREAEVSLRHGDDRDDRQ